MNIQTVSQRSVRRFVREISEENVLLKFVKLCMETPGLSPCDGHKCGGWKLKHMSSSLLNKKKPVVVFWGLIIIYRVLILMQGQIIIFRRIRQRNEQAFTPNFYNRSWKTNEYFLQKLVAEKLKSWLIILHKETRKVPQIIQERSTWVRL